MRLSRCVCYLYPQFYREIGGDVYVKILTYYILYTNVFFNIKHNLIKYYIRNTI